LLLLLPGIWAALKLENIIYRVRHRFDDATHG
jgi:hypothetical protein